MGDVVARARRKLEALVEALEALEALEHLDLELAVSGKEELVRKSPRSMIWPTFSSAHCWTDTWGEIS